MYATYNGSRTNFCLQFNDEYSFEDHVSHIKYAVIYAAKYGLLGLLKELAKKENQIGEPNYHLALSHCSHLETANYLIDECGADFYAFNCGVFYNFIRFCDKEGFASLLNRIYSPDTEFFDTIERHLDSHNGYGSNLDGVKIVFEDYKTKFKKDANNV